MIATDTVFGRDGYCFVRGVVDHHQALDYPSRGHPVEHEIHRPDLVGRGRPYQRLPVGHRDLLATPTPHLKALESIQTLDALVVDRLARLAKLQIDHPGAIATMSLGKTYDLCAQRLVVVRSCLIPQCARAHANNP